MALVNLTSPDPSLDRPVYDEFNRIFLAWQRSNRIFDELFPPGSNGEPAALGAQQTWSPTVTAQSGSLTTVSATGRYSIIGNLCFIDVSIFITTAGTGSGVLNFTLPVPPAGGVALSMLYGRENFSTGAMLQGYIEASPALARVFRYDGGSVIANSTQMLISASYFI